MEQPISSLTFSGSIPEAITEAKNQKKLFVVYISGEDEDSIRLDESLWTNSCVAECITKYCVLLHIPEGTNDATNFSAIYPQKSSPCITAVGYTGVLLWQNDGFLNPENLVSSLEKAWLSLHIQETTASVLTAALTSKKNYQSLNGASTPATSSCENGESSTSILPVSSQEYNNASRSGQLSPPESEILDQDKDGDSILLTSQESPKQRDLKMEENQKSVSSREAVGAGEVFREPAAIDQDSHEVSNKKDTDSSDSKMQESNYPSKSINQEIKGVFHDEASRAMENRDSSSGVTDDTLLELLLNIRLPNGSNLQNKFPKIDAMRLVKEYVDTNMADFNGSYDLAIPYPRKVFTDQDLDKSLAELGIINRQGLIVVPCKRDSSSNASNFAANADSSTGRVGGYFSYVRKMLSYVNPFSYLGGVGSPISTQESPRGISDYSSYPTSQNNSSRRGNQGVLNPTTSTSSRNDGNIRRRSTSRIGANIHTLKHEEDDKYDDKNTYWNGNSTEFGGNDDNRR